MNTNNLLVNNESKVLFEEQKKVERSAHNLSQSRKFPCEVGIIYPFFCRKTLPSDSFKIWSNILIKQLQPLLVPQMVSFTVNTAFYWVDYNLAFPDFEYFLINQKGSQNIELPYVSLQNFVQSKDGPLIPEVTSGTPTGTYSSIPLSRNLRSFLDFSVSASNEKIDALPFWTYQTIYRDFYLNIDRLSDNEYKSWFPSDSNKWKLKQGKNYAIGDVTISDSSVNDDFGQIVSYSGQFQYFDILRSHNVRGDYFVNSYPTPLRGDIPTLVAGVEGNSSLQGLLTVLDTFSPDSESRNPAIVGATSLGAPDSFNNFYTSSTGQIISEHETYPLSAYQSDDQTVPPGSVIKLYAPLSGYTRYIKDYLTQARVSFTDINAFTGNLSVTTRQLRLLESLTRKREIDILMKPRLKNYLQTYFGVNRYKDDSLYQPVFIGSTTQQILINDIAQTTATSDSPLGRQGATAMSLGSGYVGEYYCRNYGCLMGVMYILPDYDYEPAIPREWQERTPDEFVNPEFVHLSMSAILNKEMFLSNDSVWNNKVLGYGGMYDNYRTSQNLVCGDFLNPNYQDIRQFAQVRRFDNSNKPEITTSFLDSNSAFDKTVFSVPTLPPFVAQCVARVEAVRPLPQVAIPRG